MGSGFFLAIPVFFDTVFYLLVPLARSLHRKTGVHYLLYVLAIGVGGAITHTLVPPTPGPLVMAAQLKIRHRRDDDGGTSVALPAAVAGLLFRPAGNRVDANSRCADRQSEPEPKPLGRHAAAVRCGSRCCTVLLPVILISSNTVFNWVQVLTPSSPHGCTAASSISAIVGNANFALLLSAVIAIVTLLRTTRLDHVGNWRSRRDVVDEWWGDHPDHRRRRGVWSDAASGGGGTGD